MLHEEMLSMSAASCPSVQRPNDSPKSQLRSMEGMGINCSLGARDSGLGTRDSGLASLAHRDDTYVSIFTAVGPHPHGHSALRFARACSVATACFPSEQEMLSSRRRLEAAPARSEF